MQEMFDRVTYHRNHLVISGLTREEFRKFVSVLIPKNQPYTEMAHVGITHVRVPAIHIETGQFCILVYPFFIGSKAQLFRSMPDYRPFRAMIPNLTSLPAVNISTDGTVCPLHWYHLGSGMTLRDYKRTRNSFSKRDGIVSQLKKKTCIPGLTVVDQKNPLHPHLVPLVMMFYLVMIVHLNVMVNESMKNIISIIHSKLLITRSLNRGRTDLIQEKRFFRKDFSISTVSNN